MPEQLFLPGLERQSAIDLLFFALLPGADNAAQVVQLREYLCDENGLGGQRIAPDLLHVTLHGIGAYDGVPRAVVERAKEAATAAVSSKPFDIVLDRVMSFDRKRNGRPFVLRTGDEVALIMFYRSLGAAMKNVGFRRVATTFKPHMTLMYGDRLMIERPVAAVRWTVREFFLVQSLRGRGQSKYIHLARWPLQG